MTDHQNLNETLIECITPDGIALRADRFGFVGTVRNLVGAGKGAPKGST
jgi:hypothetical protein